MTEEFDKGRELAKADRRNAKAERARQRVRDRYQEILDEQDAGDDPPTG